jgi:hypothetical protein
MWASFGWRGANPIEYDGFKVGFNLSPPLLEKAPVFLTKCPLGYIICRRSPANREVAERPLPERVYPLRYTGPV